jgi:hypothetical protein
LCFELVADVFVLNVENKKKKKNCYQTKPNSGCCPEKDYGTVATHKRISFLIHRFNEFKCYVNTIIWAHSFYVWET